MIPEALAQLETMQGGIITLGIAALAVAAIFAIYMMAKTMISGSTGTGRTAEEWKEYERRNRAIEARNNYDGRYAWPNMKAGPKGHLP